MLYRRQRFMPRKNPRRNISRLERVSHSGKVTGGWSMRIQRRGEKTEEFFSDQRHSGKRNALVAAQQRRDEIEQNSSHYSARERAEHPSSRNKSGMVGVRLHQQKDIRGEYEYSYWYWVAQWTDGRGRRRTRSFSIHSHGVWCCQFSDILKWGFIRWTSKSVWFNQPDHK